MCINSVFLFSVFLRLWHPGPSWMGRGFPYRISQFLEIPRTHTGAHLSYANQPAQSPYSVSPPLSGSYTSKPCSCPNYPRPRCQTTRDGPYAPESRRNYSNWPVLSLFTLPYLSHRNTIQAPALVFLCPLGLLITPGASPCVPSGCAMPPVSRELWV